MTSPPPKRAKWYRATDASSLGIEIALAVTIGAVGGYYLQEYVTDWSPWTMLLGMAAGIGAAIKAVVRTAKKYTQELANAPRNSGPEDEA